VEWPRRWGLGRGWAGGEGTLSQSQINFHVVIVADLDLRHRQLAIGVLRDGAVLQHSSRVSGVGATAEIDANDDTVHTRFDLQVAVLCLDRLCLAYAREGCPILQWNHMSSTSTSAKKDGRWLVTLESAMTT
jgi:hypothetical protein